MQTQTNNWPFSKTKYIIHNRAKTNMKKHPIFFFKFFLANISGYLFSEQIFSNIMLKRLAMTFYLESSGSMDRKYIFYAIEMPKTLSQSNFCCLVRTYKLYVIFFLNKVWLIWFEITFLGNKYTALLYWTFKLWR